MAFGKNILPDAKKFTAILIGDGDSSGSKNFDFSSYVGYTNFTLDNFNIRVTGMIATNRNYGNNGGNWNITYDNTTGILTIPECHVKKTEAGVPFEMHMPYKVYLIR